MHPRFFPVFCAVTLFASAPAFPQATDVPIETTEPLMLDAGLLEKAKVLREGGKLLAAPKVSELLKNPAPAAIMLPPRNSARLAGRDVAERARKGMLRVGWNFLCPHCDHWHLNLSGGYAISADGGVATCHHVVMPGDGMREGYLVAVDHLGNVLPVTSVLAKSASMDVAILHVEGGDFSPLPLNDEVAPGDEAFCLSDPLGQLGYLSRGIVNRFYRKGKTDAATGSLESLKGLRVNVSTDWAPGSSGAAVLDECGNAIGHVSTISPMSEGGGKAAPSAGAAKGKPKAEQQPQGRFNGATLITLHEAVPARGIIALARSMNEAASKPAAETPEK